ncbi:hypothetical protein V501_03944 [Pseudogymnoascus sp. VKM F-4519 (FW-2642)]|nr:hypothetical protein V501_03944 [Pseudogymnoascus sp. VKM F-4519 (FW-2642)]
MAVLEYEYDPKVLPPDVKRSIDFLYEAADRKAACGAWADCFSKHGKMIIGRVSLLGVPALQKYAEDSWVDNEPRVHDVRTVSVLQTRPVTIRIDGVAKIQLSSGEEKQMVWIAKQVYVEKDGRQKILEYNVTAIVTTKALGI